MKFNIFFLWLIITSAQFSWAGNEGGGGGDASEIRVNEIRNDLLKWVNEGGAKGLVFSGDVTLEMYVNEMKAILRPKFVTVVFVKDDSSEDETLRVSVQGKPKTCRGFYSKKDNKPHIVCNIDRFSATTDTDQYRLIHHEFAGLVGLEENDGAASDYSISDQLTDFLIPTTVLRLSVKKNNSCVSCSDMSARGILKTLEKLYKNSESLSLRTLEAMGDIKGAATCSDGKRIFFLPSFFYVMDYNIGPIKSRQAYFNWGLNTILNSNPYDSGTELDDMFRIENKAKEVSEKIFKKIVMSGQSCKNTEDGSLMFDVEHTGDYPHEGTVIARKATEYGKIVFSYTRRDWSSLCVIGE